MTGSDPIAELREAARRMKADAGLALRSDLSNKLPWRVIRRQGQPTTVTDAEGWVIASVADNKAPHVAGMHPGVALALAGWLDAEADRAEQSGTWLPHALSPGPLAVARAYLGSGETQCAQSARNSEPPMDTPKQVADELFRRAFGHGP